MRHRETEKDTICICVAIWHYTNRNFRVEVRMQRQSDITLLLFLCSLFPLIFHRFSSSFACGYVFTLCFSTRNEFFCSTPGTHVSHNKVILVFILYSDEALSRNALVDYTRMPTNLHVLEIRTSTNNESTNL